jgi:hypothetical protein
MERSDVVKLVDNYMEALRSGDYTSVQFSPNVSFQGPFMDSPIEGKPKVIETLVGISESVKDVQVLQHIIDGSNACVLIQFETVTGVVVPILDYIQIDEDGISYIRPFFDPRPLIEE